MTTTAEARPALSSRLLTPPVIVGTLALAAAAAAVQSSVAASVLCAAGVLLVVPCALIDFEHRIIPNRLTGPAAVFALVVGLALDPAGEPVRILWAVLAGGFLLIAALINSSGMGMGDVKLLAVLGLLLGPPVIIALMIALLGNVAGAIVLSFRRGVRAALKSHVPFGPYLALGAVAATFVGHALLRAYVSAHGG
jgi:prepilin signal peptidase PulO-like enzyme (type II secretory pathway)